MASLLRESHRSSEAYEILRDAISRAPYSPEARESLAEICLEMGRWDEAIQQSNVLLTLYPRSLFARDVLSAAYLQRGLIDKALRITDEMVSLDPNDASNHFKRGVLLQQKGRVGAALAAFQRVVQMDPESDVADESRSAIEMLDNYQIRQVVMLAVEDIPFRLSLLKECGAAVASRGFFLSDRGVAALGQIRFDDLPDAPPGWRHYHYH
jgi:tetratricopeptide (TPR) repeat protein